jgi:hypothetical protein
MPGTLMFEAGVQAMSLHLAALGLTIERDGWVFECGHAGGDVCAAWLRR